MSLPIIDTIERIFDSYERKGYVWYLLFALIGFALFTIVRILIQ